MFTAFSFHWIISKLFSFFVTDPLLGSSFSLWLLPKMGSSDRLFNRQRTLHEILGGGQGIKFFFLITFYSMSLMVICRWSVFFFFFFFMFILVLFDSTVAWIYGLRFVFIFCLLLVPMWKGSGPEEQNELIIDHDLWIFAESMPLFNAVADLILWRRKNQTMGILLVTLAVWVVFERSGYTLLSLVSNVFLLLIVILFLWAKSAAILNR